MAPFAYKGLEALDANTFPVTANNNAPLFILWALVTTNPSFIDASDTTYFLDDGKRTIIASKLGLTKPYVDMFIAAMQGPTFYQTLKAVGGLFANVSGAAYTGAFCPKDYNEILQLAPCAEVEDPSK